MLTGRVESEPMTSDLISELFRIAATWTDDKARQAEMVSAWLAGQARSLPRIKRRPHA